MSRAGMVWGAILGGALAGCLPSETVRSQKPDDLAEAEQSATIGSKTAIGNVESIPVTGVGLVYNLAGTGSIPAADGYRTMLEQAIRRQKGNPKELLDEPGRKNSLVLIAGTIPPGVRVGEKFDIAVTLPPGSKTTSLRGGWLSTAELQNAQLAASARDAMQSAGIPVGKTPAASDGTVLNGNRLGIGEGVLIAGYDGIKEGGDAPDGPKAGRIWGGGKSQIDRPYYFLLNEDSPQPRLAMVIAERLNAVFHAAGDRSSKLADAKVQGRQPLVTSFVPPAYRLNHTRFLVVARLVPLEPNAASGPYRRQLENDLLRPETAMPAALKLEALGGDSRQPLRVGLQSESPWVRFASAESLAYLGHADGAAALAELAVQHPALRPQCLLALASLDDAVCLDQLAELMRKPDAQLRYGAFIALRNADENHEAIRGKRVGNSYWLHQVAPDSDPMVHVASVDRSEIVLFGNRFPMRTPFSFALGSEFTVSAKEGEPKVTVSRVTTDKNGEPATVSASCLTDVGQVLKTLSDMGGGYTEAVQFVRRSQKAEVVTTAIEFDAAPRGLNMLQLAAIARTDPGVEKADLEVKRVGTAEIVQTSYDAPTDADTMQAKPGPQAGPALNREPGRIFGKKLGAELNEVGAKR